MISQVFADILSDTYKNGVWFRSSKYKFSDLEHLHQLGLLEIYIDYSRRIIWFRLAGGRKAYWHEYHELRKSRKAA